MKQGNRTRPIFQKLAIVVVALACAQLFTLAASSKIPDLPTAFRSTAQHNGTSNKRITLLEFSAPWCGACKDIEPGVKAAQSQFRDSLQVVNIDVSKAENARYIKAFHVEGTPTFIIYDRHGKALEKIDQDISASELMTKLKSALDQTR